MSEAASVMVLADQVTANTNSKLPALLVRFLLTLNRYRTNFPQLP